jgi:glutaredoxin
MITLKIISLIDCPYSMAAEDIINKLNIKKTTIDLIKVSRIEKESIKEKYKISTFPQIYINNNKIGGFDSIKEMQFKLKELQLSNNNNMFNDMITFINNTVENINRKDILRIIELFTIPVD